MFASSHVETEFHSLSTVFLKTASGAEMLACCAGQAITLWAAGLAADSFLVKSPWPWPGLE